MILSDFSIRRPVATLVVVLGLMALGLLALARQDYPRVGYATVYRTLQWMMDAGIACFTSR